MSDTPATAAKVLALTLPWPPSLNNSKVPLVIAGRVKFVSSGKAKDYFEYVAKLCMDQTVKTWAREHWGKPVALHFAVYPPDKGRHDLSNLCKVPEDALVKAGAIKDDSLVWDLRLTRACLSAPPGRIVVRIRTFDLGEP